VILKDTGKNSSTSGHIMPAYYKPGVNYIIFGTTDVQNSTSHDFERHFLTQYKINSHPILYDSDSDCSSYSSGTPA
jgi:hypothetical protein